MRDLSKINLRNSRTYALIVQLMHNVMRNTLSILYSIFIRIF